MNSVHPVSVFVDLESGAIRKGQDINSNSQIKNPSHVKKSLSRRTSFNEEEYSIIRPASSTVSLSAELVEAVMHDGQYRFTSEKANEVAMWCGLLSFLVLGLVLVILGLFMAVTGRGI